MSLVDRNSQCELYLRHDGHSGHHQHACKAQNGSRSANNIQIPEPQGNVTNGIPGKEVIGTAPTRRKTLRKQQGTSNRRQRNGRAGHLAQATQATQDPDKRTSRHTCTKASPGRKHSHLSPESFALNGPWVGTGPRSFGSTACCAGLWDGARVKAITPTAHRGVLPGSRSQGRWTLAWRGITHSKFQESFLKHGPLRSRSRGS